MKRYLQHEINKLYEQLNNMKTFNEYKYLIDALAELLFIQDKIKNKKSNILYNSSTISLNTIDLTEKNYEFIKEIIEYYSNIPYLEIESYISYPNLKIENKFSHLELINYWNQFYNNEFSNNNKIFTDKNVQIFDKSKLKILLLTQGQCYITKSLRNSKKLLLDRYYNINDLIIPCSKGIYFLNNNTINNNNNFSIIIESFINCKATQYFKSINEIECEKQELIHIDSIVTSARYLKSKIHNKAFNEVSTIIRGELLLFINTIFGIELANSNIYIKDLIKYISKQDQKQLYDFSSLGLTEEQIINNTKDLNIEMNKTKIKI